ncbi:MULTISPECIES: N-acetylmuramoyl-L-alanine amidase [Tatumella]|uniref:N-acetylmuramoyl-L-alanine amidase n=1 Tax=Tatumella punctata TaxID=399969 RepID=A0ABW1VQP8_9GAMM|nr:MULTISPECIES: N-acetylmuramoyl-L-alanine amidase [unclassified Tatumella]
MKCVTDIRPRSYLLWLAILLSGCHSPPIEQRQGYSVDHQITAAGQQPRVQMAVIHYTAEDNARSLDILSRGKVSAHYLIPEMAARQQINADSYQLVPETQVAWHAGNSRWRGLSHLNNISIGIELVNQGYYRTPAGYRCDAYSPRQIAVLTALLQDIIARYALRPQNIVGHSDIAPLRKQDPGPCFPWEKLAKAGVGAWPDSQSVRFWLAGRQPRQPADQRVLLGLLNRYGYQSGDTLSASQRQMLIKAFQMHFRPSLISGLADAQTEAIARALLQKYGE